MANRVALFLDRDGTINTEVDFLTQPDEVILLPNAAKAICEANAQGFKVFVITNQSGIARGDFSESELAKIHHRLVSLLKAEGAHVDGIAYCPHHPEYGIPPYNVACTCRKPQPGMILDFAHQHGIDLTRSFVIGDRRADVQAGLAAGCTSILVLTGYGKSERSECSTAFPETFIASNLYSAWKHVQKQLTHRSRKLQPAM
ncbi:MAG: HAD family hydrolase [Ignavibacteriales bacterium]|nr:HAD family hydrolase [Ignavibacteriales bacterium]